MDVYGTFLKDFYAGALRTEVLLHNNYGDAEELPVDAFFRTEDEFPDIETYALSLCKGKILDIGAGTGTHSLVLQQKGFDVTAIEISEGACQVMALRGVQKIINQDITNYKAQKYDTLLLMMNGIGFCGYVQDLKTFLMQAKNLLNPGGKIIFDSSDVAYLYENEAPEPSTYYGEIDYQYEYNGQKSDWFSWLYIHQSFMQQIANETGWQLQIIYEDEDEQYLGMLSLASG